MAVGLGLLFFSFFFLPSLTSLSSKLRNPPRPGEGRKAAVRKWKGTREGWKGAETERVAVTAWLASGNTSGFLLSSLALPLLRPFSLLLSSPPRSEEVVLSVCRTRRLLPLRAAAHACLLKLTLRERWGKREEGGRRASDLRRPRSRDGAVYSARGSLCGGRACVSS